ncbi:MAG: glycine betaine ABC transporter substrate-binding protein [Acidimicrobiia bacterium]
MSALGRRALPVGLALALALGALACGGDGDDGGQDITGGETAETPEIVVGSKLDTEAKLLAHLMAQTLGAAGYEVATKIPLGNTDLVRRALENGEIDIYWEFTSSGLSLLGAEPIGDPEAAYQKVKGLDADNGVTWLPPADMNDTYALAVADDGPIEAKSLSELASSTEDASEWSLCVDPEGGFREDVLPRVDDAYGLTFSDISQLALELVPRAVAQGDCDVGIVYSTSALIVKHDLRVLTDDKSAFGAYTPAPTVLTERLDRWPELADDLADLTSALDTPTITRLNARVDVDGVPEADVAGDFLAELGIAGGDEGGEESQRRQVRASTVDSAAPGRKDASEPA